MSSAAANAMGPSKGISMCCHKSYQPIWSQRQLPLQVQWAHTGALAGAVRNLIGPSKSIGSCAATASAMSPHRHWQMLLETLCAHLKILATVTANAMGPFWGIGSIMQRIFRPMRGHQQHLLPQMQWAQPSILAALPRKIIDLVAIWQWAHS